MPVSKPVMAMKENTMNRTPILLAGILCLLMIGAVAQAHAQESTESRHERWDFSDDFDDRPTHASPEPSRTTIRPDAKEGAIAAGSSTTQRHETTDNETRKTVEPLQEEQQNTSGDTKYDIDEHNTTVREKSLFTRMIAWIRTL